MEGVTRFPDHTAVMGHWYIGNVFGRPENQSFNIRIGIMVAQDFICNKALHNKVAGDFEPFGFPDQAFGHPFIHPGTKIAESAVHFMCIGSIYDIPSLAEFVHQGKELAGRVCPSSSREIIRSPVHWR